MREVLIAFVLLLTFRFVDGVILLLIALRLIFPPLPGSEAPDMLGEP